MKLAGDIGIEKIGIIANKIQNEEQRDWIAKQVPGNLLLGMISYHEIIRDADLRREPLIDALDEKLKEEFEAIYRSLRSGT